MAQYPDVYRRSLADPETFWLDAARAIDWVTPPSRALDGSGAPLYRWFPDGELNTAYNCLDRHVADGRGEQTALVWDSAMTGGVRRYTYRALLDEVARFAGGLRSLGVGKGDRIVVYMPMIPEAVIAMLACARLGAVHSVVFGGFAPRELAARVDDATPKVIVAASCGLEPNRTVEYRPIIDEALTLARHRPDVIVMLQRDQGVARMDERDVDWVQLMSTASPVEPVTVRATDPLYVLYTSGTTGRPKGVVRDNGGHAVALAWSMLNVYDIAPGEVWWTASDVGWVVGHSYIVYAPLLIGATTLLYEGKPVGTPDAGAFWRVVAEHGVVTLFTAPTALRAIKRVDPDGALIGDLKAFRALYLAGERLDPDTYHWARERLGVPVVDHWWQTETGWPIAANPRGLTDMPAKPGSATVPLPGWDVRIQDDGAITLRLPLPPGALPTLWHDDERYIREYLTRYPGHYLTGDGGYFDEDGYLYVMGRTDDVINVAGHRLSTGAMEAVLAAHPAVAECAVIGVADPVKGQVPLGLVVLKAGADIAAARLRDDLVHAVRREIGPVAAFRDVAIVPALPKTRSGKILRRSMRAIADGREEPVPSTIEDPAVLENLRGVLRPDVT
ncbi:AMP-binding protein [Herbidospora cretacea]|uniref:AMP-binding protein n=1 Tax=Herbidospora cretacea TaxID=28444 RepID=UPI000773104D|nr:AMP-binding protein [Herbidospora cretacea]